MIAGILAMASALMAPHVDSATAEKILHSVNARHLKLPFYRAVTLVFDPDGRVISCEGGEGEGNPASLAAACPIMTTLRTKNHAEVDGQPAFGRIQTLIMGFDKMPDKPNVKLTPQMTLTVKRLPGTGRDWVDVALNVLVSPSGHVESCDDASGSAAYQAYAKVACAQLSGQTRPVVTDRKGVPVGYVDSMLIRFILDKNQ